MCVGPSTFTRCVSLRAAVLLYYAAGGDPVALYEATLVLFWKLETVVFFSSGPLNGFPRDVYRNSFATNQRKIDRVFPIWGTTRALCACHHSSPSRHLHDMTQCDRHWSYQHCFSSVPKHRASWHFGAILGSPRASLGQVARWESRGFRSFVWWYANERTLDNLLSLMGNRATCFTGLRRNSAWVENSMPEVLVSFSFVRA